jgi:hypothetical protein
MISKEEVNALLRLLNTKILKKSEIQTLDFEGFQQFLVQMGIFIYSRPPKKLGHMPIHMLVQELMKHFRDTMSKQGRNTILYDDPDSTEMGDKELNKFLNDNLKADPDYALPDAYKKVYEKNLQMQFMFPPTIELPEAYTTCYEILDDIIQENLQFHLFEPMASFYSVAKAKMKILNPSSKPLMQNNYMAGTAARSSKIEHEQGNSEQQQQQSARALPPPDDRKGEGSKPPEKKRVLNIEQKIPLSLALKQEVAKAPFKERSLFQEVAEVVQEMVECVDEGKTVLTKKEKGVIINKALEMKQRIKEEELKKQEAFNNRRKLRDQIVKTRINREYSEQQKPFQLRKDKIKEEEKEKKRAEKEKWDKMRAQQKAKSEKLHNQAVVIKEDKKKEKEEKKSEEEQKTNEDKDAKKKAFDEFNVEKKKVYRKNFDEIKTKREQEEKEKKDKEIKDKEKLNEHKRKIAMLLVSQRNKTEEERKNSEEIRQLVQSQTMQEFFHKYEKPFQQLFKHYIEAEGQHLENYTTEILQYKGFMMCMCEFSLFPSILPLHQLQLVFNSITREKPYDPSVPTGLTYTEFKEALLRIAVKRKEVFDKIYDKVGDGMKKTSVRNLVSDLNKAEGETDLNEEQQAEAKKNLNLEENDGDQNEEDTYNKVSDTRIQTMEGMVFYLDLPQDKQALFSKLNQLKLTAKYVSRLPPRDKKKVWIKKLEEPHDQRDDVKGKSKNQRSPGRPPKPDSAQSRRTGNNNPEEEEPVFT